LTKIKNESPNGGSSSRQNKNKQLEASDQNEEQKDKLNESLHIGGPSDDPPIFEFTNEFSLEDNY